MSAAPAAPVTPAAAAATASVQHASEIVVCVTCRPAGAPRDGQAAGRDLFESIEDAALRTDSPCAVRAVECLSACSHACNVALQAVGKTSYLFGDLAERLQRSILARLPAPAP